MLGDNHFRLVTLGRLTLLGGAGEEDTSLAKRRRKLALLAVLAMARRPIARDTLIAMFWGDQDEARARHSLSNALSSLRRSLGQRAISTRESDVALAPEAELSIDALELAEAVEGRDFGTAVDLYGGPFLEGVHVEDSPQFEQWVSRERRRLEALFISASAQHCATLARARRWDECHDLAARWLDTEPLSADAALYLLNAIKAPGTRAALAEGLEEYERLKSRLSREFDVLPERPVRELAERMREALVTVTQEHPTPVPMATPASPTPTPVPAPPEPQSASTAPDLSLASTAAPPRASSFTMRRRIWPGLAVAAPLVALLLVVLMREARRASERRVAGAALKPVIAVLVMSVRGSDSALTWLADGLPQMIAGKLAHDARVDVVNPTQVRAVLARSGQSSRDSIAVPAARDLARRVGATLVARGTISRDARDLVLDLTVHDVGSGSMVNSVVLTRPSALTLADEAAARILTSANFNASGPQFAQLETSSVEAYQHYMRALEAGTSGRFSEWRRELDAALALDSGFIPVIRAKIGIAIGDNDTSLVRRLRETMARYADRASPFDEAEQVVNDAFALGEHERSEALGRDLVRRYPRDPRSYHTLESILGSHGKGEEGQRVAIQALALDSLAIDAGRGPCAQCAGFSNVVGFAWGRGDLEAAAEWSRRWIRALPDGALGWSALAWTYSYMQRPDSAIPLMQRAVTLSGQDLWALQDLARMLMVARRLEAADTVIAGLESSTNQLRQESGADLRVIWEREHGRIRAANRALEQLLVVSPNSGGFITLTRADNQRMLGDYVGAARQFEAFTHPPGHPTFVLPVHPASARAFCWQHALAADAYGLAGDTVTVRAKADTLEAGCHRSFYGRDWRLYHHARGFIAMRGGRYAEAEKEFKAAVWGPVEGWSRTIVELARAQSLLGRPLDAVATLRTGYATRLDAMGRYVPISEFDYHMAKAFAQAGQRDSARVYADHARAAWHDADPEIRRLLAELP